MVIMSPELCTIFHWRHSHSMTNQCHPLFFRQGTQKTVSKILRTCPRSYSDSEASPRLNQYSDLHKICVPLSVWVCYFSFLPESPWAPSPLSMSAQGETAQLRGNMSHWTEGHAARGAKNSEPYTKHPFMAPTSLPSSTMKPL